MMITSLYIVYGITIIQGRIKAQFEMKSICFPLLFPSSPSYASAFPYSCPIMVTEHAKLLQALQPLCDNDPNISLSVLLLTKDMDEQMSLGP